jgi:hypothetical protein
MIELTLSIEDTVGPALAQFGDPRNQSRILNFILSRIGRRYRAHMRANYLAGQMIDGGRGAESLNKRLVVYKDKKHKNVYLVGEKMGNQEDGRPVKLANIFVDKDGHWVFTKKVEGRQRPFMSSSYGSFGWDAATKAEVESVMDAEIKKAQLA